MIGIAVCIGIILNTCSVLNYSYSSRVVRKKESIWKVVAIYALIIILAAVANRYFMQAIPGNLLLGAFLKFTASLPTVLFALKGYLIRPTKFSRYILLAIGIGMIADIAINIKRTAGGAFFLAGHLLYDFAFLGERKPSKRQIALWLALSALMIIPLYTLRIEIGSTLFCIGGWFYISVLISTIIFSWPLERLVFTAAVVFAFSDCFMIYNFINHGSMLMKILALVVYYGSLLLYGAVIWRRNYNPASIEREE